MAYIYFNPNPYGLHTGDCVLRALSKLLNKDWESVYIDLCIRGFNSGDWGSSNMVWSSYLYDKGYRRKLLPDTCPDCYTVKDFCDDYKSGRYLLALHEHVIAVIDGDYYDIYDSGNEVPIYYWKKEV